MRTCRSLERDRSRVQELDQVGTGDAEHVGGLARCERAIARYNGDLDTAAGETGRLTEYLAQVIGQVHDGAIHDDVDRLRTEEHVERLSTLRSAGRLCHAAESRRRNADITTMLDSCRGRATIGATRTDPWALQASRSV